MTGEHDELREGETDAQRMRREGQRDRHGLHHIGSRLCEADQPGWLRPDVDEWWDELRLL